jgi:uncharacterized membrane protein
MEKDAVASSAVSTVSRARLEFLVDGIFAIAMTILVLELKVPEIADRHSRVELVTALGHHAGTFISYLLSFVMLGILWHSHNRHYRHFQRITTRMLILTLAQVAMAAFFPFCAALFGRYPTNPVSIMFYVGCVMVYQWAALLAWLAAGRAGALDPQLPPAESARLRKRNLTGCIVATGLFAGSLLRAIVQ